mmetsp:Transcript_69702/g.145650  ORF Transcript_69702/g.145650 Transcript_69702/m.145650 type:complete len:123 (-) Transcript_69702:691-1059(-)
MERYGHRSRPGETTTTEGYKERVAKRGRERERERERKQGNKKKEKTKTQHAELLLETKFAKRGASTLGSSLVALRSHVIFVKIASGFDWIQAVASGFSNSLLFKLDSMAEKSSLAIWPIAQG